MTSADLLLARDADADATAAAVALWAALEARVAAHYAGAALDLVAVHVGEGTDLPVGVLREAVVRCGLYLRNTEVTQGRSALKVDDYEFTPITQFYGSAIRGSSVAGLLAPWKVQRAGAI